MKGICETIKNKSFFITGATGYIGSALVMKLLELNKEYNLNIKLFCYVRQVEKAKRKFGEANIDFIVGDFKTELDFSQNIDYVVHCASPTDSKYFITNPVETFMDNLGFTDKLIQAFKDRGISAFLYLSSLEIYGTSENSRELFENTEAVYSALNVRNSYPLAKIACEELLFMHYKEYGLPIKIARLTQTFGRGVAYYDNRVFAQFARSVAEGKDIVLNSKGETVRSYCSIDDAVSALLFILVFGENGEAYNVSSDNSTVSILELARLFCEENKDIKVVFDFKDNAQTGYLKTNKISLNNAKLKGLGWQSTDNICSMVKAVCDEFKSAYKRDV